jgi:excinuclease ABC subunit A
MTTPDSADTIQIRGARQNNLKNLDLDIPTGELVVVTGPSGSGKSSLVFDTLYAEGQRRYVETFSPYARQFLDRMDKPQVDRIDGVPPAIAIDQTNPVRTSRSTVGTMTELNDHLKLLFARCGHLNCRNCGAPVARDTPATIAAALAERTKTEDPRLAIVAPVNIPANFSEAEIRAALEAQGYARMQPTAKNTMAVVVDRFRFGNAEPARVNEALEAAFKLASGRVEVHVGGEVVADGALPVWKFSSDLHCADCDIHYSDPTPAHFSFNSAVGACEACRGFGRVIGIDPGLIVPDESKTLAQGAIKPWQTESYKECQTDLAKFAKKRGVAMDIPWRDLPEEHRRWIFEGDEGWVSWEKSWPGKWYGVKHFFDWLESKAYKMHIRVLLSRYRAYTPCTTCAGARLKTEPLLWRVGSREEADHALAAVAPGGHTFAFAPTPVAPAQAGAQSVAGAAADINPLLDSRLRGNDEFEGGRQSQSLVAPAQAGAQSVAGAATDINPLDSRLLGNDGRGRGALHRFRPRGVSMPESVFEQLPGLNLHDVMQLPIARAKAFFDDFRPGGAMNQATELVLGEIRSRLGYLCDVGLSYLTLDRQSRTLSGGEVQRINLTTALGTSLVNTLFVLDEPSIGLHPRDMERINGVMHRLRDAGNSLIVVEHDPAVMFAADRILDIGPGPGKHGGNIVFWGSPDELRARTDTLTAQYLGGHRRVDAGLTARPLADWTPRLRLVGPRANNLRGTTLSLPLHRLVALTGVSGSGKSTLIQDVLFPALQKHFGQASEAPGAFESIEGLEEITGVVMVDQTQIGKTTRSNPASYVGAFDTIRKRFAALAESAQRGYTAGTFSFNAGDGRCPTCGGNGFEHVEMQFLSDVYIRCPDCDGRRFRAEVLEVKLDGKSVADVLDMTISEALDFFERDGELARALQPLVDVGLDYLTLGQPVPTLSGGEAQRLKLAGHLAQTAEALHRKGTKTKKSPQKEHLLFLFDEPTTGLHFDDVAKLLRALSKLVDAGHSVLVIEHNLDVIAAADWVIDLGPEGGDEGGDIVFEGTATELRDADTHTGRALADYLMRIAAPAAPTPARPISALHSLAVPAAGSNAPRNPASTPRKQGRERLGDARQEKSIAEGAGLDPSTLSARAELSAQAEVPAPPPARGGRLGGGQYATAAANDAQALIAAEPHHHYVPARRDAIGVVRAREHNLKNVTVDIPHRRFTVVTGVSGSGKSTLAFDIIFAEGQRRYLESLNAYARQFVQPAAKPDVDAIFGIPPTVAIEQRTSRGGRKSTVGTLTEIHHFLRLMFVKLGTQHCPDCGSAIEPQSPDAIAARILRDYKNREVTLAAPLVINRKGLYTDLAKWANGKGYAHLRVDGELLPTKPWPRLDRFKEHVIELPVATLKVGARNEPELREALAKALEFGKGVLHLVQDDAQPSPGRPKTVAAPSGGGREAAGGSTNITVFSTKRACPSCGTSFPELDPRLFSYNSKHGWCPDCMGTGHTLPKWLRDAMRDPEQDATAAEFAGLRYDEADDDEVEPETICDACDGARLNPTALAVRYRDQSIADYARHSVEGLADWVGTLKLAGREGEIGRDIVSELKSRLSFLKDVGLGYLALDRAAPTLSGGEAQRIRLAAQLGTNLRGVCYVLDEPSIGLHPRDNDMLLDTLHALEAKGNTVVVVEHDEETIRRAHHVIDLGPGAGTRGGTIVAEGDAAALMAVPESVTGRTLRAPLMHPLHPPRAVDEETPVVTVEGASLHNLKDVTAEVPLGRLIVVTGVSGSGKSTLARDVLHRNLRRLVSAETPQGRKKGSRVTLEGCDAIHGWEPVGRVLEVDQTPIGKTPRSCPATYIGFWDAIRKLYADSETSRLRGWAPGRFSFNTAGGRCDACDGQGQRTVEMSFLPDVKVPCDVCNGARFNADTLTATWRGKSIADVLAMEIDEAVEFFAAHPVIQHPLKLLQDVGLGYLTLGQPSPTLSGGEAQRIKLVTELVKVKTDPAARARARTPHTLYVLDEPTVGLHMADVEKLIHVLHRLVDAGNTVLVIEHDLDVMAEADWIIDLGPEGGDGGGEIVFAGPVAKCVKAKTHTGRALKKFLAARRTI